MLLVFLMYKTKPKGGHEHIPVVSGHTTFDLEVCMAAEQAQLCVPLLQRKTLQGLSLQQE